MNLQLFRKNKAYYPEGPEVTCGPKMFTLWLFLDGDVSMDTAFFLEWVYKKNLNGATGNQNHVSFYEDNLNYVLIEDVFFPQEENCLTIKTTQYEKLILAWRHILKEKPEEIEISDVDGSYKIIATFADGRTVDYGEQVRSECKLKEKL